MKNLSKIKVRKEILSKLNEQTERDRQIKSEIIKEKLLTSSMFREAHLVMFYVSKKEEVDTESIINEAFKIGKRIAVPYTVKNSLDMIPSEIKEPNEELEIGPYGIRQPKKEYLKEVPVDEIDLVIVPGVAFDESNNRIGRGKGYYDRFLQRIRPGTVSIGICFDFQIFKSLPKDTHDLPVSKVITN